MEFRGDQLRPKPHRSVAVYLLAEAPPNKHSITQELAQPIAMVTAHLVKDGNAHTLVRELPEEQCYVNAKLHCTVLRAWSSYTQLARDTHTTTPKLIPSNRLRMATIVIPCKRQALKDAARLRSKRIAGGFLGVAPYF